MIRRIKMAEAAMSWEPRVGAKDLRRAGAPHAALSAAAG